MGTVAHATPARDEVKEAEEHRKSHTLGKAEPGTSLHGSSPSHSTGQGTWTGVQA